MDPDGVESGSSISLSYGHVGLAFSFILFDALVSFFFGLEIGNSLVIAAVRSVLQLAAVATLLQNVFEANNPWVVAGITCESQLNGQRRWGRRARLILCTYSHAQSDGDARDGYVLIQ